MAITTEIWRRVATMVKRCFPRLADAKRILVEGRDGVTGQNGSPEVTETLGESDPPESMLALVSMSNAN